MFDDEGMEEIKQIFLEESGEGLDIMETGLLNLNLGEADLEVVNDIFRAAHSIKGGGGTFGFMEVSEFTHGVETILDQMRDGKRSVTNDAVQLLLESVDCLRAMMDAIRDSGPYDEPRINALKERIELLLSADDAGVDSQPAENVEERVEEELPVSQRHVSEESGELVWEILFKPHLDMLKSGNEPGRIFKALKELGELQVSSDTSKIPSIDQIDPDCCYIGWTLQLTTQQPESKIREIFEWVVDECELSITSLSADEELEPQVPNVVPINQTDNVPQEKAEQPVAQEKAADKVKPAAKKKPVKPEPEANKKAVGNKESSSIRVDIEKIDSLLNLVGELVITQSMLVRYSKDCDDSILGDLRDGLEQLERNARELQESAMQIRMLPIKVTFSRFPRLVRDLGIKMEKKIELKISGDQTELDKTVLEKIGDPLVHLVRNSLDHGIETVEKRKAAGKPETGVLHLSASHEAGNIVIKVEDDGAGLNRERILEKAIERGIVNEDEPLTNDAIDNLIFQPGFSTAEQVSDVSGRGVGMDVVRRNIQDLGGRVDVHSTPGVGSVFTIRLPLTLAILDGQLVRVGDETYVIPLLSIVESVLINPERLSYIANDSTIYRLREEFIPVLDLKKTWCQEMENVVDAATEETEAVEVTKEDSLANKLLVVVEADRKRYGLVVDELCDQQQVVIKALETNYKNVNGLSGSTILGDGAVALILDIPSLMRLYFQNEAIDRMATIAS